MKDHDAPIDGVAWAILLDRAHDAANELNERAQVCIDAANHRYREIAMIEPLPEHPSLHDDIQLVILKLREDALVGIRSLARVHISGSKITRAERFSDLNAVIQVESRSDDFQTLLSGLLAQATQLVDCLVNDRSKRLV